MGYGGRGTSDLPMVPLSFISGYKTFARLSLTKEHRTHHNRIYHDLHWERNMLVVDVNKEKYEYDIHSLVKAFYPEETVKDGRNGRNISVLSWKWKKTMPQSKWQKRQKILN